MPNTFAKNINVSITAGATNQDVFASDPELKLMLMNGYLTILATQPSGVTDITMTVQVGTEFPARNTVPNDSSSKPSILNGDQIVNNHPAYAGTPVIVTAANANAAAQILSLKVVQEPA